jgi:Mg2+/Co2+ transporter CorC
MLAGTVFRRATRFAAARSTLPAIMIVARSFAVMSDTDLNKRLDAFQELFVEARLTIEDCNDAANTKYFDEEADTAKEAVEEAVNEFQTLIGDLDDQDQKTRVLRGNGLKVEQLKGELEMALNGGHH